MTAASRRAQQRRGSLSRQRLLLAWLAGRADPQEAPRLDPWG
ncbi:hypothetical protein [Kocuria palustris]|nr:hypothetical protein [Kocuria palustris]